jgi:hypothetical protein
MTPPPDQRPGNRFNRNRPSQPRSGTSQHSQNFDSHGPGDRIRGSASQIYERYLILAREAARSDDRVASEQYYQHAEHYFRVGNAARDGRAAAASLPIDPGTAETGLPPAEPAGG